MKKTVITLKASCKKAAYCNREEYFLKYGEFDKNGCFKGMQNGAPLILNIDGFYYYFDKLEVYRESERLYEDYRRELKNPMNVPARVFFIWR